MTTAQIIIALILLMTLVLLVWGRLRHDLVALVALFATVSAGLVPADEVLKGFAHPAVVTVGCVLILSRALVSSGVIDALALRLVPNPEARTGSLVVLILLVAVPSAFMNNVGALAMAMPIGLRFATQLGLPPGKVLMPMAFGSMLGGMTTLVGTPPNLIVSGYRAGLSGTGFGMFDFAPVGGLVAVAGIAFLVVAARYLVPKRKGAVPEAFDIGAYLTEAIVPEDAKAAGLTLAEIETELQKSDAQIVGLIRNRVTLQAPSRRRKIRAGDILVIEADPATLAASLGALGLKLAEAVLSDPAKASEAAAGRDGEGDENAARRSLRVSELELAEVVVLPGAGVEGLTAADINLRTRYGLDLLAISRQGSASTARLRATPLQAGDVLLLQGAPDNVAGFVAGAGCAPLAARTLRIPDQRRMLACLAVVALVIAMAASGFVRPELAFLAGATAVMALGFLPLRTAYAAIDGPVIVLLAALFPVAAALTSTGLAELVAVKLVSVVPTGSPALALAIILLATMTLSDLMNNAATAAIMCPIAISVSQSLGVNPDAFLMAVAVGASCAFLTPIGHQNNTLIMGPGGFRFGDYWPLGLPLEIVVAVVATFAILWIWPLA
jgi:di/tricarboxylate transporter